MNNKLVNKFLSLLCKKYNSLVIDNQEGHTILKYCNPDAKGKIRIPYGVTSIEDGAFYDCKNITSIIIPDSVVTIGNWAFSFCYKLSSVNLPKKITRIGEHAFRGCRSLESIVVPDNISMGTDVFRDCESLVF